MDVTVKQTVYLQTHKEVKVRAVAWNMSYRKVIKVAMDNWTLMDPRIQQKHVDAGWKWQRSLPIKSYGTIDMYYTDYQTKLAEIAKYKSMTSVLMTAIIINALETEIEANKEKDNVEDKDVTLKVIN